VGAILKNILLFIRYTLFALIATVFTVLGSSEKLLIELKQKKIIGEQVDVGLLKDGFLILSVIFSGIVVSYDVFVTKKKLSEREKEIIATREHNKLIFFTLVKRELGLDRLNLKIRVFVPNKSIGLTVSNILTKQPNKKKEFKVKYVEGISDKGLSEDLKFEVNPTIQGLIGKCYHSGQVEFDCSLITTNNVNYNLTSYQKQKSSSLKFCSTSPVINSKNEVVAIVSFECNENFNITHRNQGKWEALAQNFCVDLIDQSPNLFK
jgi:hypothetical protein